MIYWKKIALLLISALSILWTGLFISGIQAANPATVTIGTTSGSIGQTVSVPLTWSWFPTFASWSMWAGAFTAQVQYDNTKLSYSWYTINNIPSSGLFINPVGNSVNIVWSDDTYITPIDANWKFITLNFSVISWTTESTPITFTLLEVTDPIGDAFPDWVTAIGWSVNLNPITVPNAPTIGTATGSNASATVSFTAPANNGWSPITMYTVYSSTWAISATGTSSPININGLTNGTSYSFTVKATNVVWQSIASSASNSVTPTAPATCIPSTVTNWNVNITTCAITCNSWYNLSWNSCVYQSSGWGGGGGSFTPNCLDSQLDCKLSWNSYSYFKKDWVSCLGGNLWKSCNINNTSTWTTNNTSTWTTDNTSTWTTDNISNENSWDSSLTFSWRIDDKIKSWNDLKNDLSSINFWKFQEKTESLIFNLFDKQVKYDELDKLNEYDQDIKAKSILLYNWIQKYWEYLSKYIAWDKTVKDELVSKYKDQLSLVKDLETLKSNYIVKSETKYTDKYIKSLILSTYLETLRSNDIDKSHIKDTYQIVKSSVISNHVDNPKIKYLGNPYVINISTNNAKIKKSVDNFEKKIISNIVESYSKWDITLDNYNEALSDYNNFVLHISLLTKYPSIDLKTNATNYIKKIKKYYY